MAGTGRDSGWRGLALAAGKERRILAVPALGPLAGGTGAVGRLLWDVVQREWPEDATLVAMRGDGSRSPTLAGKLAFGATLARRQAIGGARWVFFGHLGLAKAQQFLPQRWRSPHAMLLYGVEAWKPITGRDRRYAIDARLRVAISQFTADRVVKANPGLGPIAVCPLALPLDAGGPRTTPSRPGPKPTVLIVGRMAVGEGYKGHDQLIEAWPHVTAAVPGAELLIAGDGDDAARLREKARQTASGRGIRFTGFVDRDALDRLYGDAAVFAMPSRGEGFGLVYLEAMAHRLPCVGSVHDAAGEVIEHGTTGLLVNLDDREALGRTIVRLLQDPGLRDRMGHAGFERLERHFSFDRFSRDVVGLLRTHMEPA